MLQFVKKRLPKPIKQLLITAKQKTYDQWYKKRLFKRMQLKHAELLKQVKGKEKIKVVFLVIHKSVWKVDPVFQKMLQDPIFEPEILVCPYTSYGEERMLEDMEQAYNYFFAKGYPVRKSLKEDGSWLVLDEVKPDIVFFTNPYALTRKEYYQGAYLNCLSCYVPYYFMATKHAGEECVQLNTDFLISLWKVFWAHDYTDQQYKKLSVCKGANSFSFGYPAVEGLLNSKSDLNGSYWKEQDANKKKIIFAPHHTIENDKNSLSTFMVYGEYIKKLAFKYKDSVQWSFKPHPILKAKLYNHPDWGVKKTNEYYDFWKDKDYTQLDDGEYEQLFISSDAIIHDCSSFIVEYAFTNNSCLYLLSNNLKNLLNDFGQEIIQVYEKANSEEEIEAFVAAVVNYGIRTDQAKKAYFNAYVDKYYKVNLPSERIVNDIKKSLGKLSGQ